MPHISVTVVIPDGNASRAVAALEGDFGRLENETDTELVQRSVKKMLETRVLQSEARTARAAKLRESLGLTDPQGNPL